MNDLTFFEGAYQLLENLVSLLKVEVCDRIAVNNVSNNNELTSTISIGKDGNYNIVTHWENIYPSLKQ